MVYRKDRLLCLYNVFGHMAQYVRNNRQYFDEHRTQESMYQIIISTGTRNKENICKKKSCHRGAKDCSANY